MSEKNTNAFSWLHGLEEYFAFVKDHQSQQYVKFLLKLLYANNPVVSATPAGSMEEFVYTLRKFASSPILDILYKYYRKEHNPVVLQDAFSRGQVQSKIWLATELAKIKTDFNVAFLLGGWYGQLLKYFDAVDIQYKKARIIDMDKTACQISDTIFNLNRLNNFDVKSAEMSIEDIVWNKTSAICSITDYGKEKTYSESLFPDLIINSSSEHMSDDWFFNIKFKEYDPNPIVVIQSNNLFDIPEHINCVHSVDHMRKKFPMREVLYEGELQLTGYKRFMLIGRP